MQHISDQVHAALIAGGWQDCAAPGGGRIYEKVIVGWAAPGAMVPDGRRKIFLHLPVAGRWFLRLDGWGDIEREEDLRNFKNAADAIAAVLNKGE